MPTPPGPQAGDGVTWADPLPAVAQALITNR